MKERNDWLLFNLGLLIGIVGLIVVVFVNHGVVALGLEGLLLNKLGRSLFAWATKYGSYQGGPRMLNNPLNKLLILLMSIAMAWGGLAMMWFANQMLTYAFITYSIIRSAIEGLLNNPKVTLNPDVEVVNQIVSTYKQITARYPNAPEETILGFTVREVLTLWKEPAESVQTIIEKNVWNDIHSAIDYLMLAKERLADGGHSNHEIKNFMAGSHESYSRKQQVDALLNRR